MQLLATRVPPAHGVAGWPVVPPTAADKMCKECPHLKGGPSAPGRDNAVPPGVSGCKQGIGGSHAGHTSRDSSAYAVFLGPWPCLAPAEG